MDENKKENKLIGLYLLLVVCALVLFLLWIKNLYFDALGGNPFEFSDLKNDESKRSALGALGDYFGGLLNPILAFLSFIALLWTLKINQEELAETRKELARAAKAQEESKKIMDEQLKTQKYQQADNFFSLMFEKLLTSQPSSVEIYDSLKNSTVINDLNCLRLAIKNQKELLKYFRLLFQTFHTLNEILNNDHKKLINFIKVIRSQQDQVVLELLFIYISENREKQSDYHKYLKSSNFFKHLKLDEKTLQFHVVLQAYEEFTLADKKEFFERID